jgi:alkanesulfonate monooxygenase SsuD/methylene tetrahydromethanopterin reductase-like flavin-dependent oxidoreductase (luciferase family)
MTAIRPLAVAITPLETRRDVVLHVATRAEELGYDAFFVAEGWGHDVSVLLAEIAMRTSRIRIGTGVVNVWGRSAASIAMLTSSLAELSGGRFVLGLGAGTPQLAEALHDVTFRAPVDRLAAVTRQVRGLLAGERIVSSVPGGSRPLRLGVLPPADVPIHLAALGPQAVRLCGELADGWFPFLLPLSGLKDGICLLEEGAARGLPGRPLPQICPGLPVAVAPDPAQARALASWWVAFYLTSMGPLYGRISGTGDSRTPSTRCSPPTRLVAAPRFPLPRRCCSTSSRYGGTRPPRGRAWTSGTPPEPTCRSWCCRRTAVRPSWITPWTRCARLRIERSRQDPPRCRAAAAWLLARGSRDHARPQ